MQVASQRSSPSCVIQEAADQELLQQNGFGSPLCPPTHTAMTTSVGFGSPVNTDSVSAPPSRAKISATDMPAVGSPFGSAASVASDSQPVADSMAVELLAASTAAADTDNQLGPSPQSASPAGMALLPLHLLPYASTSSACTGQCFGASVEKAHLRELCDS